MGVPSFNSFDERTHVGRQNMLWEQTNMYKRIHGVKSTVDTKLVRHARPKSAVGAPPRAPRSTSSARCARRRAASTT